jgi:hypothetical protein
MAKFYVTKEETCPRCKGWKFVQAQIWKDYWEWFNKFKKKSGRIPNRDEDRDWWAELGYWENDPDEPIPPEEHECPDCNGLGVKVEKVELADALRELERI